MRAVATHRSLSLSIALRRSAEEECRSTSSQWIAEEAASTGEAKEYPSTNIQWIAEEVASAEEEENGVNEVMGDEGMCDSRKDAVYH